MTWRDDLLETWPIPNDHSRQVNSMSLTKRILQENKSIETVLDLGCGNGNSVDFFRINKPNVRWVGLDTSDASGFMGITRTDAEFYSFDGINSPFEDNHFDLIYCNQVFEHVRYPVKLLKEVQRILKIKGYFVGSTSQLEPYHSYSTWNYTPYGFQLLVEEAGLQLIEVRPSIDGLALMISAGFKHPKFLARWFKRESPLNKIIGLSGKIIGKSHKEINLIKLAFCGQFCFLAQKQKK